MSGSRDILSWKLLPGATPPPLAMPFNWVNMDDILFLAIALISASLHLSHHFTHYASHGRRDAHILREFHTLKRQLGSSGLCCKIGLGRLISARALHILLSHLLPRLSRASPLTTHGKIIGIFIIYVINTVSIKKAMKISSLLTIAFFNISIAFTLLFAQWCFRAREPRFRYFRHATLTTSSRETLSFSLFFISFHYKQHRYMLLACFISDITTGEAARAVTAAPPEYKNSFRWLLILAGHEPCRDDLCLCFVIDEHMRYWALVHYIDDVSDFVSRRKAGAYIYARSTYLELFGGIRCSILLEATHLYHDAPSAPPLAPSSLQILRGECYRRVSWFQ